MKRLPDTDSNTENPKDTDFEGKKKNNEITYRRLLRFVLLFSCLWASSGVRDLMEMVLVIPLHGSTLCSHPDSGT